MHDEASDVLQPMIVEDDDAANHHRSWQRRPSISVRRGRNKTRSTVLGWAVGTFALLTSLTFVRLLLDAEVRFDSPVRKYLHDPEHEDIYQAALDERWKQGFTTRTFNEFSRIGWKGVSVEEGSRQGENIWTDAMMDAMSALGYSMLVPKDTPETYAMFRQHHRNFHRILWSDAVGHGKTCLWNSSCVYAGDPLDEASVPLPNSTHVNIRYGTLSSEKVFNMHWWNGPLGPLGRPFTTAPEPYHHKVPTVPFSERPRQAYVFAKSLSYFERPDYILADPSGNTTSQLTDDFYEILGRELDMTTPSRGSPLPSGNHATRKDGPSCIQHTIAGSKVVLGIGRPALSPTPYEALCLGVPFINVVQRWDRANPENRAKWYTIQHDAIMRLGLGEPYVYHVRFENREALKGRYIPARTKMSSVVDRVKAILDMDPRSLAKMQLQITNFTFHD
ncbi:hypothetical protein FRB90_001420 [Tulasnella sp. 427]|nr:hypothetical protein FRB90_001420 [Tulasnella sp. 427]